MSQVAESRLRITVAQIGASHDVQGNVRRVVEAIDRLPASDCPQIAVFPECILTGYMYSSVEETRDHAIELSGPELGRVAEASRRRASYVVVGFLESCDGQLFNSAAMYSPEGGLLGCYRKVHLPFLGADRFVSPGTAPPPVLETAIGKIGIGICYDLRFPENARCLALGGAELIVQPSTMPDKAAILLEHFVPVRACENRVYFALANRGDEEAGVNFSGLSQIVSPKGFRLAQAADVGEEFISVEVELGEAREKRIINTPGEYEVSLFEDRRPSTYTAITSEQQV